jgi:cytidylate kinase
VGAAAGVDPGDMHRMEQLAIAAEIELAPGRIRLNGEDVTDAIRTPEVSAGASKVAVIPGVRRAMVAKQRAMGERSSVVMEGRDIGTVVFPNAEVKIFLDADPASACAAARRMRAKGEEIPETALAAQMKERDQRDSTRADAPLAQAPDAAYLDSTSLSRWKKWKRPFSNGACAGHQRKGFQLNDLLVMKFGGTSVGSAERMRVAARIAAGNGRSGPWRWWSRPCPRSPTCCWGPCGTPRPATARPWIANLALRSRHEKPAANCCPKRNRPACWPSAHELIGEFERIVNGMAMLGERPPRSVDEAVAVGERLSALLVAEYLKAEGTPAAAVNARDVVVTDAVFGNASPLMEAHAREGARQAAAAA